MSLYVVNSVFGTNAWQTRQNLLNATVSEPENQVVSSEHKPKGPSISVDRSIGLTGMCVSAILKTRTFY